ncbi:YtxH domain-containing protein [Thermodesulfovibrio hydrogeniphilus]
MREEGKILAAFLLGGVIGAAFALLYAPKSGEETRREIKKKAKELKKKTVRAAEDIYEEMEEISDMIKRKMKELKEKGHELSEDAREEILNQIDKLSKMIEEKKKKLLEKLG